MSYSIKMKIYPSDGTGKPNASKFLGCPVIPDEWLEEFDDNVMFLMQIKLSDIAQLDSDNLLPHKGYLYVFLDTTEGIYNLKPIIKYYDAEPYNIVDNFNSVVPEFTEYLDTFLISFELENCDYNGTKLLGNPSWWNYQDQPGPLLFQFDPLDNEINLFPTLDGLLYFFFNQNNKNDFSKITLIEDYS